MPPGEFEDRQHVKREQEMIHARRKVMVYAVLMALLWAAATPINVIVARQNPRTPDIAVRLRIVIGQASWSFSCFLACRYVSPRRFSTKIDERFNAAD